MEFDLYTLGKFTLEQYQHTGNFYSCRAKASENSVEHSAHAQIIADKDETSAQIAFSLAVELLRNAASMHIRPDDFERHEDGMVSFRGHKTTDQFNNVSDVERILRQSLKAVEAYMNRDRGAMILKAA